MEKLYTVNKNKTRSCGSDHELFIAKFRLKLKKVGKSTASFIHTDLGSSLKGAGPGVHVLVFP